MRLSDDMLEMLFVLPEEQGHGYGKAFVDYAISKYNIYKVDVNEDNIIKALTENGEMHFEEILGVVDLSVPQLNSLLIKMTAVKLITKTKHNYWSI